MSGCLHAACSQPWFQQNCIAAALHSLRALAFTLRQVLGQSAVHGAFAGYTGFTPGLLNTCARYLFALPLTAVSRGSQSMVMMPHVT